MNIDDEEHITPRIFTLEEARALLPRVKAIFVQFSHARLAAADVASDLEGLEERRSRVNVLELARPLREKREELGDYVGQMRAAVREILELGIEIKHLDPALIDFRCIYQGRVVYLCWQEGEDALAFWHDLDAGFAGRRPL